MTGYIAVIRNHIRNQTSIFRPGKRPLPCHQATALATRRWEIAARPFNADT